MADLREFQVGEIATPAPISQKFAADVGEATKIAGEGQGLAMAVEGVANAAVTGYKFNDMRLNNAAAEEITSGGSDADPEALTDFQRISRARNTSGTTLTAERAEIEASKLLQTKVKNNPRRAEAYKAAYKSYFGDTGAGATAFTQTTAEKFDESRTKFGFDKFGMDPNLRANDPVAWEREFQSRLSLMSANQDAEALTASIEAGNKLDALAQSEAFPSEVTNMLTNNESKYHLGTLVSNTLVQAGMTEDMEFSGAVAAQSELALNNLQLSLQSQFKQMYPDLSADEFNDVFKPVVAYIDNVKLGVSGELNLEALQRENKIFTEAAILDGYKQNPEAAQELIRLKNMVSGLPTIPFDLEQHIVKASRAMIAGGNTVNNPGGNLSVMDYANNASDIAALNVLDRTALQTSGEMLLNGDPRQKQTATNNVVRVGQNILAHPDKVKANTYLEYYGVLSQEGVLESMTPEQQELALTTLGAEASQKFLMDTIAQWKAEAGQLDLTYNTTTNRLEVVGETIGRMAGTKARTANAKLGKTNVFFKALQTTGVLEGMQGDMNNLLTSMGVTVVDGKPKEPEAVTGNQLPTRERQRGPRSVSNQVTLQEIDIPEIAKINAEFFAGEIASGEGSNRAMQKFGALLAANPELRYTTDQELNSAIDMYDRAQAPTSTMGNINQDTPAPAADPRLARTQEGQQAAPVTNVEQAAPVMAGLIDRVEAGPEGYDATFGNMHKSDGNVMSGKVVTSMTIGELKDLNREFRNDSIKFMRENGMTNLYAYTSELGTSAVGRYQFTGTTMAQMADKLDLPDDTVFTPEVQDRMFVAYANERLAKANTQEEKRLAMRQGWEGFQKVSDEELDAAIADFEAAYD